MLSRNRMFLVCLQQAQRKMPSFQHVCLSTPPSTSTPIGKLWVGSTLGSNAELLLPGPEYEICLMEKHGHVSWAPGAGSIYLHQYQSGFQGTKWEGTHCWGWVGKPSLSLQWQPHDATQQSRVVLLIFFILLFMESKKLFLHLSNSLWTVSKTWEVS